MEINGSPLVNGLTVGNMTPFFTAPRSDTRAPVRHLAQEKIDRCVIDAARSWSLLFPGICKGSASASLVEYNEACYPETPLGNASGDN